MSPSDQRPREYRRIVTGLNADGKSCVIIDGPLPRSSNMGVALAWHTPGLPADNMGDEDSAPPFSFDILHTPGSNFAICIFAPNDMSGFMHATDTIDYLVVLEGQVELILESEVVPLRAGDFIVDRGVVHGWSNPHDERCVVAVINLPAHPVGKGRTI